MNRIVGQASSLLESGRLEACPTTMAVHGSNVHPLLEVAAPHEPLVGRDIHAASTYYGTGTCRAEAA